MYFKEEYVWRKGDTYMFMTNFDVSIKYLSEKYEITKPQLNILLHVYSFSYFTVEGVARTSTYKNVRKNLNELSNKGFIRVLEKGSNFSRTKSVYCISPNGELVAEEFYNKLLNIG